MTRKEAIARIKDHAEFHQWYERRAYKITQAFEMAIKALEQPEIIRCAECKWFQCNMRPDGILPKGVEEFECRHWCGWCDPVDFCSYAERKQE